MKKITLLLLCIFGLVSMFRAQIGHRSTSFTDITRNNREVTCEVYYPAETAGDDVPVAEGPFGLILFGHGFVMEWDAYQNLWEALVPAGYIMVFATTEGGFAPDHADFGLDLAFLGNVMLNESTDPGSPYYGRLTGYKAVAGHSMGGGASFLAASQSDFHCVIGLAPANTNPSAIDAAAGVDEPVLVLSGSADEVTPPANHHIPIYEGASSECKAFVNLMDGSHCYFANEGSLCDLGEFFPGSMTRETQQAHTNALMLAWLDWWMNNGNEGPFLSHIDAADDLELTHDCAALSVEYLDSFRYSVYPNPSGASLFLESPRLPDATLVQLSTMTGMLITSAEASSLTYTGTGYPLQLCCDELPAGIYLLRIGSYAPIRIVVE